MSNVDTAEIAKFSELAHRWWDPNSEFKPLHEINPLRLKWIDKQASLAGRKVLDVGCGGGILAEAMAGAGAKVSGIDLSDKALKVAKLHLYESGKQVDYQLVSAEDFADQHAGEFDIVTC
ncbi:MAG: bifunctional 2-polyprenyl-6-hydroxyphenol methylase/3-demethylubiquinol 3-O-methyltransferase UbiG, partial [Thiobacillus sp.]|nr:bifunctional 2-polyprenyl-6-hydroxyphenol methylase/3-demethylubiquinol 3-O-methyltransferase UbiG [Thiobacillus sp.]